MQTVTKESIQTLLKTNDWAVVRGLEAIYARQTADERSSETTSYRNGMGFNGRDAGICSSFVKQIAKWRDANPATRYRFPLSPKQLEIARRAIFKYSGQLLAVAEAKAAAVEVERAAEAAVERAAIQTEEVQSIRELEADRLAELEVDDNDPDMEPLTEVEEFDEFLSLA